MKTKGKKILIVDDDKFFVEILSKKLIASGFDIYAALNGEDGLKSFKEIKPDLILLDILMPVIDGLTFLKQIRDDEYGKNVPVFVLTNVTDADKTAEAAKLNVNEYLIKADWAIDALIGKMNNALA